MKKKMVNTIIIIILIILGVLLVWGLIGANEAKSAGVTCDTGIGDSLCWKWHKNALGQFQEAIGDLKDKS
ncbi:hypothetical protein A3K73_04340 [Candidatus Pacearchaeota archaeon RBG_13_36_9]|nr:MAG: hypothetical protein A3K73_04340 [Candidatus Pacearchaeota archaeon RBG_13_36_9]